MAIDWKNIMKQPAYQIRWTIRGMGKKQEKKEVIKDHKQSELFNAKEK